MRWPLIVLLGGLAAGIYYLDAAGPLLDHLNPDVIKNLIKSYWGRVTDL